MAPKASTLPMLIHKEFANLKFSLYATSMREFPQMEHLAILINLIEGVSNRHEPDIEHMTILTLY
ncbi:hypothetical protein T08_4311 [Trichinella sp. T8]|nr:hypothetical protein T08_4311 [Trichinella sp. T8]